MHHYYKNEKTKIVSVDKKGQKALTTYTTIKTYQDVSLLKIKIHYRKNTSNKSSFKLH